MFYAIFDRLSLQHLGCIQERAEIGRIAIGLIQVVHNLPVGGIIALMLFHYVGEDISVLRKGKAFHCLFTGEGLEAEFGSVPEIEIAVIAERLVSMPYLPVMHIPAVWVVGTIGRNCRRTDLQANRRCLDHIP